MNGQNPYIITPLTGEDGFYGRTDILAFVRNTLASPYQKVIVLYGQRRIGKTSLLHQLRSPQHVPPGYQPIYFDLQGRAQQPLNEVLYGLAREVAKNLDLPRPKRADFQDEAFFQDSFLPRAYEALGDRRLLFLIDEFDVLGEEPVSREAAIETLFPYLQELILDEERIAFIFVVGRRIDELPSRIKATFKSAQFKQISVLNRRDAERLIVEPARGRLSYRREAVERILELTAGHPYFTQLLGYTIFDSLRLDGRMEVTVEDVEAAVEQAMELGMGGLAWFWDEFPPAERFILSAIAHVTDNGEAAHLSRIRAVLREHGVRLQGMELASAPTVLTEWGIIYQPEPDCYRFVVEFLRRWIRTRHSLAEAKRELESVSPRATSLYEAARSAHAEGDLDTAIEDYRRALAANPNHTRAQLGLAQALYERGDLPEAIEAYQRAYDLDHSSARDGLLTALREYAASLEEQGEAMAAVKQYARVLEYAPDDLDTMRRLRAIWQRQAEAHLAAGRLESALAAYQEALRLAPEDPWLLERVAYVRERLRQSEDARLQRALIQLGVLKRQLAEEREARAAAEHRSRQILRLLGALVGVTLALELLGASVPPSVRIAAAIGVVLAVALAYWWATR